MILKFPHWCEVWRCIAYVLLIWIRMREIPKGCWKKITGSPTSFDLHPLIMELNAATQISLFGHPHITFWQKLLKVATTTLSLLLNGIQLSASHFYCEKEDIQSICTNYVNNAKYCGKRIYWSIHVVVDVVVGTYNAKQFLKGMDLNKSFKMHWNTLMQRKKKKKKKLPLICILWPKCKYYFLIEANFGWIQDVKNCHFNHFGGFEFWFFENFTLENVKNFQNFKMQNF